jgi:hypothetical protein
MAGRSSDDERWGVPPVVKLYERRVMEALDGSYRLTATPRAGYGQPFWFGDESYNTKDEAMRSSEFLGPRGPVC